MPKMKAEGHFQKRESIKLDSKTVNYTIDILSAWWKNGMLEIPGYQRQGNVWKTEQKKLLIDSLINNYGIPSLVLRQVEETLEDGTTKLTLRVLDGQQRLTTILDYMSDKWKFQNFYFKQMSENDKLMFRSINIPVTIYTNMTDEAEREMYIRFQNGTRHNINEVMHASDSKVVEDINRELKRQRLLYEKDVDVNIKRYNDAGFLAQMYMWVKSLDKDSYQEKYDTPEIKALYNDNKQNGLEQKYLDEVKQITDAINVKMNTFIRKNRELGKIDKHIKLDKGRIITLIGAIKHKDYKNKNLKKFMHLSDNRMFSLINYLYNDSKEISENGRKWMKNQKMIWPTVYGAKSRMFD